MECSSQHTNLVHFWQVVVVQSWGQGVYSRALSHIAAIKDERGQGWVILQSIQSSKVMTSTLGTCSHHVVLHVCFEKRLRLTLFQRCGIQRCNITPWTNIPYMTWNNNGLDPCSSVEGFDTNNFCQPGNLSWLHDYILRRNPRKFKWPNNFGDEFANGSSRTKKNNPPKKLS